MAPLLFNKLRLIYFFLNIFVLLLMLADKGDVILLQIQI